MSHDTIALIAVSITLLGVLITSTWKFSALATSLNTAVSQLTKDLEKTNTNMKALESIPRIEARLDQVEANHSLIPKLEKRIITAEKEIEFSLRGKRISRIQNNDED